MNGLLQVLLQETLESFSVLLFVLAALQVNPSNEKANMPENKIFFIIVFFI
ncbi:hypothetical protein BACCOP_03370 [Phocaeicola coprocola DSM 17136]|uniref:Uncharacterized protein n=1 Tax=Phocaeicola coprocola DSM 17136 TaxID=470145 RepID=B3JN57_9BACT|nr:hypothetical protein BACCOP_03370 [Phocaeicola coprocola DSM 17136]